jgi:hypothetical protein
MNKSFLMIKVFLSVFFFAMIASSENYDENSNEVLELEDGTIVVPVQDSSGATEEETGGGLVNDSAVDSTYLKRNASMNRYSGTSEYKPAPNNNYESEDNYKSRKKKIRPGSAIMITGGVIGGLGLLVFAVAPEGEQSSYQQTSGATAQKNSSGGFLGALMMMVGLAFVGIGALVNVASN